MKTKKKEYRVEMQDEGGCDETVMIFAETLRIAKIFADRECEKWVLDGDWDSEDNENSTVDYWWELYLGDDQVGEGNDCVLIKMDHDQAIEDAGGDSDCDHAWTSEGEGGCNENPGCWSEGGTRMRFRQHCKNCGITRETTDPGMQHNPGECEQTIYSM